MKAEMSVKNPDKVRREIEEYYRGAELWLPDHSSHRVYKVQAIKPDGKLKFIRIRDRITSKKKLRKQLIKHTPLNVYFTVSSWLNPSKTGKKTYKDPEDGREHFDKNGFLFSDMVIDCDHEKEEEVLRIYKYIHDNLGYREEDLEIVHSGGGYHINIWDWYRNRSIQNPIEREEDCFEEMQRFTKKLKNEGFEFDYFMQNGVANSPSADTRRVRKLPKTITKYGNKSDIVPLEKIEQYEPQQVIDKPEIFNTKRSVNDYRKEVKRICQRNKSL